MAAREESTRDLTVIRRWLTDKSIVVVWVSVQAHATHTAEGPSGGPGWIRTSKSALRKALRGQKPERAPLVTRYQLDENRAILWL